MMSTNQKVGLIWEKWVLERLHEQGYGQARLVSNYFADIDIMLGNLPIEVKAATGRRHWAGCNRVRWQFDTSRGLKGVDKIIVLVAVAEKPYAFVVPSWDMTPRYNIHITSHPMAYRGLWSKYLEAWSVVDMGLAIRQAYSGQMIMPGLVGVGNV
jgi:hypothetical protein